MPERGAQAEGDDMADKDCDVAVIGGGPAGSTAAALLALKVLFYPNLMAHPMIALRGWRQRRENIRDADTASAGA